MIVKISFQSADFKENLWDHCLLNQNEIYKLYLQLRIMNCENPTKRQLEASTASSGV